MSSPREVLLIVSVDTEEDDWRPARSGVTVENVRELGRVAKWLGRLGLRATFFTTYQVAIRPWAVEILRGIQGNGGGEIGAHLHPWNTPPLEQTLVPRATMLKNLPASLQLAKVRELTTTLTDAFGAAPTAFRAGRYGLGAGGVAALRACGYELDSSVTPFISWEAMDDGPTFVGAPLGAYRIGLERDVAVPDARGPLVEIPLTCGYTRFSSRRWRAVHRVLRSRPSVRSPVASLASRLGFARLAMLAPDSASVHDMLAVSRGALAGGVRHLQLTFHSPSLRPGLTPWISTRADVERVYAAIEAYVDGLSRMASVRSATLSEARVALGFGEPVAPAAA